MNFKNFYFNDFVLESLKQGKLLVQQGKLSQDVLDKISKIDPTPQKKFVGWMAKQWVNDQVSNFDELRNTIEEWNSFLNKGKTKNKDIYAYKSFHDLKSEVHHLNQTGEGLSGADLENDYEVVRDDKNLLVCVPHTHESSRKLGLSEFAFRDCGNYEKDSAWCTTYKAPDKFNDYYYKNNVTFYYVKVRSEELKNRLTEAGYSEEYFVTAIAVLDEELSDRAISSGHQNMDAYDGLDRQFNGDKLNKYLEVIGLS
jgi:hypothetical protein